MLAVLLRLREAGAAGCIEHSGHVVFVFRTGWCAVVHSLRLFIPCVAVKPARLSLQAFPEHHRAAGGSAASVQCNMSLHARKQCHSRLSVSHALHSFQCPGIFLQGFWFRIIPSNNNLLTSDGLDPSGQHWIKYGNHGCTVFFFLSSE